MPSINQISKSMQVPATPGISVVRGRGAGSRQTPHPYPATTAQLVPSGAQVDTSTSTEEPTAFNSPSTAQAVPVLIEQFENFRTHDLLENLGVPQLADQQRMIPAGVPGPASNFEIQRASNFVQPNPTAEQALTAYGNTGLPPLPPAGRVPGMTYEGHHSFDQHNVQSNYDQTNLQNNLVAMDIDQSTSQYNLTNQQLNVSIQGPSDALIAEAMGEINNANLRTSRVHQEASNIINNLESQLVRTQAEAAHAVAQSQLQNQSSPA